MTRPPVGTGFDGDASAPGDGRPSATRPSGVDGSPEGAAGATVGRSEARGPGTGRFRVSDTGRFRVSDTGRLPVGATAGGRSAADDNTVRPEAGTQTLAASWTPERRLARRGRRAGLARYGWRVYAVPVLLTLTALVILRPGWLAGDGRSAPVQVVSPGTVDDRPTLAEAPGGTRFSGNIPSAELPGVGGEIPLTGGGSYRVLQGTSPRVGTGRAYTFSVEVEDGVTLAEGDDSFGRLVQETLLSPQSWVGSPDPRISLQRVDRGEPDFRVTLLSQETARRVCEYGKPIPYDTSCYRGDGRVYINAARWVRGAIAFHGDIGTYRRYAINHEVGHFFNKGHVPCTAHGELAPVMMQQTFSVSNNDLSQITGNTQGGPIPRNGMVCKPNAWPYPQGASQAG